MIENNYVDPYGGNRAIAESPFDLSAVEIGLSGGRGPRREGGLEAVVWKSSSGRGCRQKETEKDLEDFINFTSHGDSVSAEERMISTEQRPRRYRMLSLMKLNDEPSN